MARITNVGRECQIALKLIAVALVMSPCFRAAAQEATKQQPPLPFNAGVGVADWPQMGGTPHRNNVSDAANIPTDWDIKTGKNIKWRAKLGWQTYGNVVVANGKIFVGSDNGAGYLKRFPPNRNLAVLLCFRESDGEFLWQYSSENLRDDRAKGRSRADLPDRRNATEVEGPTFRWRRTGIYSSPVVEGDRLWLVTNRAEVVCLDAEGFLDKENDGPFRSEKPDTTEVAWDERHEADVVWSFDMIQQLGVLPYDIANCSPTIWGDVLFVCTSNSADAPNAPSFIAMDKQTGQVLWTDNSPGSNILNGQWSSPSVGVLNGVPQVLFAGGDGWLYSFRADRWKKGKPELLWKFDGNPKDSIYQLPQGKENRKPRSTRNGIVSLPVIADGLVYLSMGQSPLHGDGPGSIWCIDPSKQGDVSPELVVDPDGNIVPHQRFQATARIGEIQPTAIPNPNSAVVWHFDRVDRNENGRFEFDETMHWSLGSPAIKNDLLFIADFSGLIHCLNSKTGKSNWTCDTLAACWSTPLIAGESVYVADGDGEVAVLSLSPYPIKSVVKAEPGRGVIHEPRHEISMETSIYTTPVVVNGVLYIATQNELFAIAAEANNVKRQE